MRRPILRTGFSLVELLVVLAMVAVLVGILLPSVQKVRELANRLRCQNQLKQIGLSLHHYHDAQRTFPPGYQALAPYEDGATDTTPGWGWATWILPYVEQDALYRQLRLQEPLERSSAIATPVTLYQCPSDQLPAGAVPVMDGFGTTICLAAPTSYAACVGGDESATTDRTGAGIFFRNSKVRLADITDGTSETLLIGERAWSNANGFWAGAVTGGVCKRGILNPCPGSSAAWSPAGSLVQAHSHLNNADSDTDGGLDDFSSRHPGGSNFVFADGAVHFLRSIPRDLPDGGYAPDSLLFQALGTRARGEVVTADELQ